MTTQCAAPLAETVARGARRGRMALLAGAVALAGVAAPVAPAKSQSTDELLALLLGATAVALIVRAFDSEARPRQRLRRGFLPDACLERVRLHRRDIDLYHASCLDAYGIDRVPRRCATTLRTDRGQRRYFLAQCLYEANWRPQRGWTAPGYVHPHDGWGWRDDRPRRPRDRDDREPVDRGGQRGAVSPDWDPARDGDSDRWRDRGP
jgi:hypothetical protein